MNETVSKLKRTIVATSFAALVAAPAGAEEVLNVTNWAEYIAEDTISNFEKEFGIKVVYDHYDSVEAIDSKLLAGNSGYDVVSHSSSRIARLIPADIVQPLDKSKLPNMQNMMAEVMEQLDTKWDPGNNYIVPYMWGTHGVTYNRELVLETYPDAPIGSMDLILDPVHMKEIAKCGVAILDSPTDIIPMTLAYLGLPPDSTNQKDYTKVKETLLAIRRNQDLRQLRLPAHAAARILRRLHVGSGWAAGDVRRGGSQHRSGARLLHTSGRREGEPVD